jgi:hypothetical protein
MSGAHLLGYLPFTTEAFFGVFERYNEALWPAPVFLTGLALGVVALAFARRAWADRAAAAVLALLWVWMAVAYHWAFFAPINPAAWAFGGLFALQALVFAWTGVVRRRLRFAPGRSAATVLGSALIAYALLIYPLLGAALGHRFPAAPTFGLPCPTTLFTVGLLAFLRRPFPAYVLVIPALWAAVGASAAFSLGVLEDLGLIAAGLIAAYLFIEGLRAKRERDLALA